MISLRQIGQILESSGSSTSLRSAPFRSSSVGGGAACKGVESSIAPAAFDESWRAKSEAYHHSRNLRKNIDVGRRTLRESRSFGRMTLVKILGENIDQNDNAGSKPGRGRFVFAS